MAKRGLKGAVGITYRPRITPGLPVGSLVKCADNSGVQEVRIVGVVGRKSRHRRLPAAAVGDMVIVSVRKGKPELKKQILKAVVIRQRKPYRRINGVWVQFEDNAVVIVSPEGEPKGTEIRGVVAKEAAERWPKIAALTTMVV
ncbi:MAG: 50S ribosomal protein L14 [Candidatus Nezhaarchaeales archaeon]